MTARTHRARKRFGQNFLVDAGVIANIVAAIRPRADDNLVEIGPGQGALTTLLLQSTPKLRAIEIDRDLVALLVTRFADSKGFQILQGDALNADFGLLSKDSHDLRIVGNLPYNISTPLLFHLLTFRARIDDMHFLLQQEVVDRIAAVPGSKNYGRLSVMIQYCCQVEPLLQVPPAAFRPAPKVHSALVRLVPHRHLPVTAANEALLGDVVNVCFQRRRKTLRNGLKPFGDAARLAELGIDLSRRPEVLEVAEFVAIANQLSTSS